MAMYDSAATLIPAFGLRKTVMTHKGINVSFRFTPKQIQAFELLCKTMKEKKTDVVKMALAMLCKKHEISFPKNLE